MWDPGETGIDITYLYQCGTKSISNCIIQQLHTSFVVMLNLLMGD